MTQQASPLSLLYTTLMSVVVSLWIFTSESALECPVLERLSRAPRDRPRGVRPRDRATPAPHGTRSCRRKTGPQRQPGLAGSVEKSRPRPPIWRGIVKAWTSQQDASTQLLHERTHVLLLYVLLRCCTSWVVGWVSRWVGCCTCCFCCRTAVVVLLYTPRPN